MYSIVSILTVVNVLNLLAERTKYGFYKFSKLYDRDYKVDDRGIIYDDLKIDNDGMCEIVLDKCDRDIICNWTNTLSEICGGHVSVKLRVRESNIDIKSGVTRIVDLPESEMEIIVNFKYVDENASFVISNGVWNISSNRFCFCPVTCS